MEQNSYNGIIISSKIEKNVFERNEKSYNYVEVQKGMRFERDS